MTLVDTNVLVYAAGVDGDGVRQACAIDALRRARSSGALSTQVLSEYANVLLRKGTTPHTVQEDVAALAASWRILVLDADTVVLALGGVRQHRLSFWDAMIWATARRHGCAEVLTEDGPIGAVLDGVRYTSPF